MEDEIDWVEVARYDDGIRAELAVGFLRSHGITVALRGNSGAVTILNRFDTVFDVRLVVPAGQRLEAEEALAAMDASGAPSEEVPTPERAVYRESGVPAARAERTPSRRYAGAAPILAVLLPFGAGHFYARHGAAGKTFFLGIVGAFVGATVVGSPWLGTASALMVAADAVGSVLAVRRYNRERVPPAGRQVLGAALACGGCALAALLLAQMR